MVPDERRQLVFPVIADAADAVQLVHDDCSDVVRQLQRLARLRPGHVTNAAMRSRCKAREIIRQSTRSLLFRQARPILPQADAGVTVDELFASLPFNRNVHTEEVRA